MTRGKHRRFNTSVGVPIVGLVVAISAITASSAWGKEESTAHVDLRLLFERSWQEVYSQPLAFQIVRVRLGEITDPKEIEDVHNWIRQFARRGFRQDDYEYCLFREERQSTRAAFLEVVQKSRYRLTSDFVRNILDDYRKTPGTMAFDVLVQPSWASFSSGLADESTYSALTRALNTPAVTEKMDWYLKALYYGYKTYRDRFAELDKDVRRNHLDSSGLTSQKMEAIYQELNKDYWSSLEPQKEWMLTKMARRLFRDFKVEEWVQMQYTTVLSLAQTLSRASATGEYEPVDFLQWIRKMGESVKGNPEPGGPRSLLVYFLQNSGVPLRSSFRALSGQFGDDQRMFLTLHERPPSPSPMDVWHGNRENWEDSIRMLSNSFDSSRSAQWTRGLWDCLKDRYYSRDPQDRETKQRLFQDVITPMFQSDALDGNTIRRTLLRQAYETNSFLLDSHRYEIAHHLLQNKQMDAPVLMDGVAVPTIDYCIHVYRDLRSGEPELYTSSALKDTLALRKAAVPETAQDRIIAYINHVIGEPLDLVCYALMGKADKTRGVVFDWTSEPLARLETLLREIVRLKGELLHNYDEKLPRISILEDIAAAVIREMKAAIEQGKRSQIVKLVRLSLKITVVLEDDTYLERILAALRKDVFGLPDDSTRFSKLASAELKEKVQYFTAFHSEDLVDALRAIGKVKYVLMFYRQLYQPLRNIYGFFHEVGAIPYQRFLNEFQSTTYDDRGPETDLNRLFEGELQALGAVHDDQGRQYINAETAICELMTSYCDRLNLDAWKDSDRFVPNVNVNLGVLHRLLLAGGSEERASWRLSRLDADKRAETYRLIGVVFLQNLANAELQCREVPLYDPPAQYSGWEFFPLLRSLLDLYEIHRFPFPELSPEGLYSGTPATGIQRAVLLIERAISPRKVNGEFRAKLFETYENLSVGSDQSDARKWDNLADTVLLLPNQSENHQGSPEDLKKYWGLRKRVFDETARLLSQAQGSGDRLHWLALLSRLEASVYGLDGGENSLGYQVVRDQYLHQLTPADLKSILFEEFLLRYVNQRAKEHSPPILQFAEVVRLLVDALCREYPLLGGRYDTLAQAILDLYRKTAPETLLAELSEEHVAYLWFVTRKSSEVLLTAAQRGSDLTDEEKRAAISIASSVFFVHSFFAPYVHGEFNVDALLKEDRRLFTFCLLDRKIKKPMAQLMPAYEQRWDRGMPGWHFDMSPAQLKTFVICHNFLPIFLLEKSLDSPALFIRLTKGKTVSLVTYNFTLLWKREDKGKVGWDSLCEEVLDGVDINRDFLLGGMGWSDRMYLEYFFGDSRTLLAAGEQATQIPRNFDTLVGRLAAMASDGRYQGILSTLERGMKDAADEETRKSLKTSLDSARRFPRAIRNALDNGYEYFGRILAQVFSSPLTIQYACEKAWQNVAARQRSPSPKEADTLYGRFYTSALFEGDRFRPDLERQFCRTFYAPPGKEESVRAYHQRKQKDFESLIGGTTLETDKTGRKLETIGLADVIRKDGGTAFGQAYEAACLRTLRGLFVGCHLDAGQPFIGDVVWQTSKEGRREIRALDYANDEGHVHEVLEWVLSTGERYGDVPVLRNLFLAEKTK